MQVVNFKLGRFFMPSGHVVARVEAKSFNNIYVPFRHLILYVEVRLLATLSSNLLLLLLNVVLSVISFTKSFTSLVFT